MFKTTGRRLSLAHASIAAFALTACASDVDLVDDSTGEQAFAQTAEETGSEGEQVSQSEGFEGESGEEGFEEDEDGINIEEALDFARANGLTAKDSIINCVSKARQGATIRPTRRRPQLPVGGGRWLECETTGTLSYAAQPVSGTGQTWCMLGKLQSLEFTADPGLTVTVTSQPSRGPWKVRIDSAKPVEVKEKAFFFGAPAWAIATATYDTVDLKEVEAGGDCDAAFNL